MKRKFNFFVVLVGVLGSTIASCTPSPAWIKSQRDKINVKLVEPSANELKHGNVKGFTLFISVAADSMSSGSGIPIYHSGIGNLGAKFQIIRSGVRYEHAAFNVDECINKAAELGIIKSYSSEPSAQEGFYLVNHAQSIEPFLDRFTDCLKDFGYTIQ